MIVQIFIVRIRLPVKSTADLAAIFNRQLRNVSVLALEPGVLDGYVDVIVLSNIRLFRVVLSASVALYANRCSGKKYFLSIFRMVFLLISFKLKVSLWHGLRYLGLMPI